MKRQHISEFTRGWFIGHFTPNVLQTNDFEVGLLTHKKGESWPKHYHAIQTEYNLLVKGKMILQDQTLNEGDIFILEPNEIADPVFLEDCTILCVKTPSIPGDKYEVF